MGQVVYKGKAYSYDDLVGDAIKVLSTKEDTTYSALMKYLHVGYARVQRLVDDLDIMGITDSSGFWDGKSKKIKVKISSEADGLEMINNSGPKFEEESKKIL